MPNPLLDRERADYLRARQTERKMLLPAWPRLDKELRFVEVEVKWVRFSTLNHRTRAEQMRAIHVSKNPDLFTADTLGPEAQDAQYHILKSQEGFQALKDDLRARKQQEPAVLTADGILINGNRRSAALRSLDLDDKYQGAKYVHCLVLPEDATPIELIDLEAELQVARDFKEDYSWINEALLIEELFEREGRDYEKVASKMHQDVQRVRPLHEKLQQVHQLVALSQGSRFHIDFEANESAFDELTKHIRNKPKNEADGVRATYFLGTLADVNYRRLRHLRRADAADMVLREVSNDPALKSLLSVSVSSPDCKSNGDPLDDVLGTPFRPAGLHDVLALVAAKKPEETVVLPGGGAAQVQDLFDTLRSAINAAADEAEEEQRDQTAVSTPVKRAEKAAIELERALSALPRARAFGEWRETDLEQHLSAIRVLIDKMQLSR